jgi:hypothetical protein
VDKGKRVTMTNRFLLVALLFLIGVGATAQKKSKSSAQLIVTSAEADGQRLKVVYTSQGLQPTDSVFLEVRNRTRGTLPIRTVSGAVGKNRPSGPNQIIYWDYALDGLPLGKDDEIVVSAQAAQAISSPVASGGGPAFALLSAVAPGVGNIFVQPTRKIGLRPLVTASYVGLLVYGLSQRGLSKQQYSLYESQESETAAQPYYDAANQYHQRYYLATRAAAAIMLTDVTFTLLRGLRNQRERRATGGRISLQYQGETPVLAYRYSF